MKPGLELTVGKTIAAVFAASMDSTPNLRAYLFFTDGTRLEFYGNEFNCVNALQKQSLDEALRIAKGWGCRITNLVLPAESTEEAQPRPDGAPPFKRVPSP